MSVNLLNQVRENIEKSLTNQEPQKIAIPKNSIRSTLRYTLPALMAGLISKVNGEQQAKKLLRFIEENRLDDRMYSETEQALSDPGSFTGKATGNKILTFLFGNSTTNIIDILLDKTSLEMPESRALLNVTSVLFMSAVGKYVKEKSIDELGLVNLISSQKDVVQPHLTREMYRLPMIQAHFSESLAESSGVQGQEEAGGQEKTFAGADSPFSTQAQDPGAQPIPGGDEETSQFGKILPWMILALASLALLWFLNQQGAAIQSGSDKEVPVEKTAKDPSDGQTEPGTAPETGERASGNLVTVRLSDTTEMQMNTNSFAYRSYELLRRDHAKPTEFLRMDRVRFEPGTAVFAEGSIRQLSDLATLLRVFEDKRIQVISGTNESGDPESDRQLAERRRDTVVAWLKDQGIDSTRIMNPAGIPPAFSESVQGTETYQAIEVSIMD